jgi:two-component system sensor histidine kinase BaeS
VLHREAVPVDWLFARAAERHEGAMRDRGIQLDRRIAPGAERVDGDARRLEQVLQNLTANAVRHTPSGGRIELTAAPRQDRVVIRVGDTGSGIAAEHLPFVFDRFYKADASRAQSDGLGSGLGLSIVKAIVEGHGGQISVSSEPGKGSVFEIVLDAARA